MANDDFKKSETDVLHEAYQPLPHMDEKTLLRTRATQLWFSRASKIGLIGFVAFMLAAFFYPAMQAGIEAKRRMKKGVNLRRSATGIHNYYAVPLQGQSQESSEQ